MFCTHCGSQIPENANNCPNCGQQVEGKTETAGQYTYTTQQTYQQSGMQKPNGDQYKLVLQIFTGIFAVVFLIRFLTELISGLGKLFGMFGVIKYWGVFAALISMIIAVLTLVQAVVSLASAASLGLTALKCEKENSESFFTTVAVVRVVSLVLVVVTCMMQFIYSISMGYPTFTWILSIIGAVVFNVVVVGGFYGILYLMSAQPLKGVNAQNVQETVKASVSEVIASAKSLAQNNQKTDTVYQAGMNMNHNAAQNSNPQENAQQSFSQNTMNQGYSAPTGAAMMSMAPLKTDRNIFLYILLTLVTCGIYGYYFIYKLAQDVNVACDGDGESTPGLLMFVLLSWITCGIYAYYWYYKLANRLAKNAPRYGMQFQENGTTVLMWIIFGMLLCGIGSFIGLHILFKNANMICAAYNRVHFGNQ